MSTIARLFWRGRERFRGSHEGQFLNGQRRYVTSAGLRSYRGVRL